MYRQEHDKKAGVFCLEYVKKKLRSGCDISFTVATDSMLPFIHPGDIVAARSCHAREIKPGDILLFERQSSLIVHRLYRKIIQDDHLLLVPKGDRAYREDEPFPRAHLLGKVVKIYGKSATFHLDRWHGRAVNSAFYLYSLCKMKAYALKALLERRVRHAPHKEDILLRLCSTVSADSERHTAIRTILRQEIDWDSVVRLARAEDTAPLMYKTLLKTTGTETGVPRNVMNDLKDSYYSSLAHNIALFRAAEQIITSLGKENVEPLVFKGLMLAVSVYRDMGLRPMGDADLLLRRDDLETADHILRTMGFHPDYEVTDFKDISPGRYRNSLVYRAEGPVPLTVHVHWHILNFTPYHEKVLPAIDMERIWAESIPFQSNGVVMRTFSLHHQVMYLSMHALNHSFHPLIRLCDIHEILRSEKESIDWDRLINDAIAFRLDKSVSHAFYLIKNIFGTDIPEHVLRSLMPRRTGMIERTFLSSVLRGAPILTGEWLMCVGMNETLRGKISFLWRLMFPPQRELARIRKRDHAQTGLPDYAKRLGAGLGTALRVLFHFTRQAAFRL